MPMDDVKKLAVSPDVQLEEEESNEDYSLKTRNQGGGYEKREEESRVFCLETTLRGKTIRAVKGSLQPGTKPNGSRLQKKRE